MENGKLISTDFLNHIHWITDGVSNVLGVCPKYSSMFHMLFLKLSWELFFLYLKKTVVTNSQSKKTPNNNGRKLLPR